MYHIPKNFSRQLHRTCFKRLNTVDPIAGLRIYQAEPKVQTSDVYIILFLQLPCTRMNKAWKIYRCYFIWYILSIQRRLISKEFIPIFSMSRKVKVVNEKFCEKNILFSAGISWQEYLLMSISYADMRNELCRKNKFKAILL